MPVADWAAVTPTAIAAIDGDARTSYAELHDRACRLAGALHDLGALPGERVAVLLPNSTDYLVAGIACAYAQVSFIPVNWHLKADELGWILADSAARVLVVTADLSQYVDGARAHAPDCRVLDIDDPTIAARPAEHPAGAWKTLQWMFYTSGTTGRPKGVVHAMGGAEAMAASTANLCALWGFTEQDSYLLAGPGYHAGPGGYAFAMLFAGGTVVLQREWDALAFFRLVDAHRVTTSFLTPAHMIRLLEVPPAERAAYDLSSLRLVIQAGAPCPIEVKKATLDLLAGTEVCEIYGASEGGVTKITAAEWRERPGSVGTPWPGVEVRILAEGGAPVPTGEDGLVYVRPAGGARFSYHADEAKTAAAWHADAFTVGDVGHLDADGYLYLTDRAADLVIRGGVNIYPREIEEVLHGHPAVVDCSVVGVPDERYGEALAAVVELRSPATPDDLREHVRAHLADYKVPSQVVIVDTVPRDPNGKVRKPLLRDWVISTAGGS